MGQRMTWDEMKKAYPDEWLLITEYESDESGHLVSGIVERHSRDMDEVAKLPALHRPTAFRYTGESTFMGLRSHVQNNDYV